MTNEDRSLMSYIRSISYGRASLEATVSNPVTLRNLPDDANPTLLAINAQPDAHRYEYLAVVYPPNERGAGGGMAQSGQIKFDPPRTPNRTKARCRFLYDAKLGTWAMEVLHNVTRIGDYYNGITHPGDFDEMAGVGATHPCTYTKLRTGWIEPSAVRVHPGNKRRYTLHAIGLSHPAPAGRLAGVKLQAEGSNRYLLVEARLKSDRWERGFGGSDGIPSEGVVVYEFAPEDDPWPRRPSSPNGPWPPLELRTPTALIVGETFKHHDSWTHSGGPRDHRTGRGRSREIKVTAAVEGGFVIEVTSDAPAPSQPDRPPHGPGAGRERPPGTSEP
ncbi:MAG: hypothetical protein ACT4QE_18295 [Anaerolineales bacterium]